MKESNKELFIEKCHYSKNIQIKANKIPNFILENESLNKAIERLPSNYDFEIHKTIYTILKNKNKCVGLQFPEGLLMYKRNNNM